MIDCPDRRRLVRGVLLLTLVVSAAPVANAALSATAGVATKAGGGLDAGERVAEPRSNMTVITTHGASDASIVAIDADGTVAYHNDSLSAYFDVDPVSGTRATVTYVAAQELTAAECHAATACRKNLIERVNLTTGTWERLYHQTEAWRPRSPGRPTEHSVWWHDVDRIGPGRFVVADIAEDRVFELDTESKMTEWAWEVQSAYPFSTGRTAFRPAPNYPHDWSHINDVEVVGDGRYMLSLRNFDRVVFVDPERGLLRNWTLGRENDYSILKEQHNPDYLTGGGGPAVVVADSENDRLVEYRRTDGDWERSWQWSDDTLSWPRDADRLPNGNTLVTDSHGNRVLEVAPDGSVAWSVLVESPYEAERIGTGDESTGGPTATTADLTSRDGAARDGSSGGGGIGELVKSIVPDTIVHSIQFVTPGWVGLGELFAGAVAVGSLLGLIGSLLRERLSVTVRSPVTLRWESR